MQVGLNPTSQGSGGARSRATITVEELVARTSDLPSLPAAALAAIREADSADGTAATVAKHLAMDPTLAARILRLANSPFYGMPRRVENLSEAVVLLGMKAVKSVALVAATYPWLSRSVSGYGLGPKEMWTHAQATAAGAKLVAAKSRKAPEDLAFLGGLLHDLGKLVLGSWMENNAECGDQVIGRQDLPFDVAEREVIGVDHQEVGLYLGRSWNLPEPLLMCMGYHHCPDDLETPEPVVDCVHVGNGFAMMLGMGLGVDGLRYQISNNAVIRLGIEPDDVPMLAEEFVECYQTQREFLEVIEG